MRTFHFISGLPLSGSTLLAALLPKVAFELRRTILLPAVFEQYSKLTFWQDGRGSTAHVIRTQPVTTSTLNAATAAVDELFPRSVMCGQFETPAIRS